MRKNDSAAADSAAADRCSERFVSSQDVHVKFSPKFVMRETSFLKPRRNDENGLKSGV